MTYADPNRPAPKLDGADIETAFPKYDVKPDKPEKSSDKPKEPPQK